MHQPKPKELINYELKIDGFSVIDSEAHGFRQLSSLACSVDDRFADSPLTPYRPTIYKENDLSQPSNKDISRFNDFCLALISEIKAEEKYLDAIFATLDTPDSKHIAQDPHFDRIPTLKFMLYLNDLLYTSGAFCLSPGSHLWTKENFGPYRRRKSHGAPGFLEKSRNIPAYILKRLKPIEGKAGTIIVFDTDCIHHQGIVQTGQANIIRAHYRVKAKNSTIGNFIKKIKG